MPRTAKPWKPLDIAVAQYFADKRLNAVPRPSYRELGAAIEVSHTRVSQVFSQQGAPPSLSEFVGLCHFFRMQSSDVLAELEGNQSDGQTAERLSEHKFVIVTEGGRVVEIRDVPDRENSPDCNHMATSDASDPTGRETPGTLAASLTDEERRELVLRKLKAGDVRLAAHVDPYKHEEMEGGDGR